MRTIILSSVATFYKQLRFTILHVTLYFMFWPSTRYVQSVRMSRIYDYNMYDHLLNKYMPCLSLHIINHMWYVRLTENQLIPERWHDFVIFFHTNLLSCVISAFVLIVVDLYASLCPLWRMSCNQYIM